MQVLNVTVRCSLIPIARNTQEKQNEEQKKRATKMERKGNNEIQQ